MRDRRARRRPLPWLAHCYRYLFVPVCAVVRERSKPAVSNARDVSSSVTIFHAISKPVVFALDVFISTNSVLYCFGPTSVAQFVADHHSSLTDSSVPVPVPELTDFPFCPCALLCCVLGRWRTMRTVIHWTDRSSDCRTRLLRQRSSAFGFLRVCCEI